MEQQGGILVIYRALALVSSKTPFMLAWEKDLGQTWSLAEWHRASESASQGILNIALVEANLKVLMRWYIVPL